MKKQPAKKNQGLSRRIHFPEDEKKTAWLPPLLDAYAIADTGVAVAIRNQEKIRKKKLACGKACGNCCRHQKDLPVYPHELVGIYWYVAEKMALPARELLKQSLSGQNLGACPFLIEDSCSIHPVRPLGCRQFNVFTTACSPGEDPYFTRREDVLELIPEYTDRVFATVIRFYSINPEEETSKAITLIRSQIMNLRTHDWTTLVDRLGRTASR